MSTIAIAEDTLKGYNVEVVREGGRKSAFLHVESVHLIAAAVYVITLLNSGNVYTYPASVRLIIKANK
jgi:hypothetical protein